MAFHCTKMGVFPKWILHQTTRPYATPFWFSRCGLAAPNPREQRAHHLARFSDFARFGFVVQAARPHVTISRGSMPPSGGNTFWFSGWPPTEPKWMFPHCFASCSMQHCMSNVRCCVVFSCCVMYLFVVWRLCIVAVVDRRVVHCVVVRVRCLVLLLLVCLCRWC